MATSDGGSGCFDCRAARVSSLQSANLSSEDASLIAPGMSPSSNFSDTLLRRVARDSSSEKPRLSPPLCRNCLGRGSCSSVSCCLMRADSDLPLWSLPGTRRQRDGNKSRRSHALGELSWTTSSRMLTNFRLLCTLAALGICFKVIIIKKVHKGTFYIIIIIILRMRRSVTDIYIYIHIYMYIYPNQVL